MNGALTSHVELWVGENTHRAQLDLADHTGAIVTDATVTITLYERDGTTPVSGPTWPISLTHEGGGRYAGTIPANAELVHGRTYALRMVAERGFDKGEWRETGVRARYRGL